MHDQIKCKRGRDMNIQKYMAFVNTRREEIELRGKQND